MLPIAWNTSKIKQCNQQTNVRLLSDEQSLADYQHDFGHIIQSQATVIAKPLNHTALQSLLAYAKAHQLPLTIRANGLSQSGQSLAVAGGLIVDMSHFNHVYACKQQTIWVDACASWHACLKTTLNQKKIPLVLPFNCDLSISGVLSAGGIGASSFKYGSIIDNVLALEVITSEGSRLQVKPQDSLFHACLGGVGQFGIITKACLALRPCKTNVRTFFLSYLDADTWFKDLTTIQSAVDYIETFASSALQGNKLIAGRREPFAQWLYALQFSIEYDDNPPVLAELNLMISPWKYLYHQDELIASFLYRHNGRFAAMKLAGLWQLTHPWYECFISETILKSSIVSLLAMLPLHYASVLHVTPVAAKRTRQFLMLPDTDSVYSVMILHPGIVPALLPSCLTIIASLDAQFLATGGKRYLSGFLGHNLDFNYWQRHFGKQYIEWIRLKKQFDPDNIFCSTLFPQQKSNDLKSVVLTIKPSINKIP